MGRFVEVTMKRANSFQRPESLRPGTTRGRDRILWTTEIIETVQRAVEASPRRSAVLQARTLPMTFISIHISR